MCTPGKILAANILLALAVTFQAGASPALFVTSQRCFACHNNLQAADGTDISIGRSWSASMMAHSAKDPYWQASVRRETIDHPSASAHIQDECSSCHMPMMRYREHARGGEGTVFEQLPLPAKRLPLGSPLPLPSADLAGDGVSCSMCHQIEADGLGTPASFTAGFVVDESRPLWERSAFGPYTVDRGRSNAMLSASGLNPQQSAHIQSSAFCGSCHTLITQSLDKQGNVIGELPEQVPFLEWRHSDYVDQGTCQSCHMPEVAGETAIASVLGQPREKVSRHVFRGGNFFMLSILQSHGNELSVLIPSEDLGQSVVQTREHLQTKAANITVDSARLEDGRLSATVVVRNLAGHKLPTAYPSRRAWIHFTIRDSGGRLLFESGKPVFDGSISGNDNDRDPTLYEPHFQRIESADQVQVYEGILAGPGDNVTTGLLEAVRYIKDNRILPDGFDKETASAEISVKGLAGEDTDFAGGTDVVIYAPEIGEATGPLLIEAELWYQPIGYRWARNLENYSTAESEKFTRLFRRHADRSAMVLARDRRELE